MYPEPFACSRWRIRERAVPWGITTIPPSSRHQMLLVAVNRAAAFNVAARWVLHDLRSPAQSLMLMADLIAEPSEDLEDTLREACANLGRSLELLGRVVHPLTTDQIGPLSVTEPITFVADLHRAGRTHARVELDVTPALPPAVGVARHLEHALLNLLLYAGETPWPSEPGVIRISARLDGDRVLIVLGWDGPPVPPEVEAGAVRASRRRVAAGAAAHHRGPDRAGGGRARRRHPHLLGGRRARSVLPARASAVAPQVGPINPPTQLCGR